MIFDGKLVLTNSRKVLIGGLDGKLVFINSRKVLIGGLDGNFLLYNQGFTTTLSGEVSFISPIWPHKTYGCNQIHVCKVNTSEILRAVHVHKHQYVV